MHCNQSSFLDFMCTWILLFCRVSTKRDVTSCNTLDFFLAAPAVYLQLPLSVWGFRLLSAQNTKDLWATWIQIPRSVNSSEGGSSVNNGYWNEAEECQWDKEKNEQCCSVNTRPPVPTHPSPSASRHGIISHNDTSAQISPSLFFF